MVKTLKVTNDKWVTESLSDIREGKSKLSYHLLRQLEGIKMIEPMFVRIHGKKRPVKSYILTRKGRSFLGLIPRSSGEIA